MITGPPHHCCWIWKLWIFDNSNQKSLISSYDPPFNMRTLLNRSWCLFFVQVWGPRWNHNTEVFCTWPRRLPWMENWPNSKQIRTFWSNLFVTITRSPVWLQEETQVQEGHLKKPSKSNMPVKKKVARSSFYKDCILCTIYTIYLHEWEVLAYVRPNFHSDKSLKVSLCLCLGTKRFRFRHKVKIHI